MVTGIFGIIGAFGMTGVFVLTGAFGMSGEEIQFLVFAPSRTFFALFNTTRRIRSRRRKIVFISWLDLINFPVSPLQLNDYVCPTIRFAPCD